jgi:hypothetical protein
VGFSRRSGGTFDRIPSPPPNGPSHGRTTAGIRRAAVRRVGREVARRRSSPELERGDRWSRPGVRSRTGGPEGSVLLRRSADARRFGRRSGSHPVGDPIVEGSDARRGPGCGSGRRRKPSGSSIRWDIGGGRQTVGTTQSLSFGPATGPGWRERFRSWWNMNHAGDPAAYRSKRTEHFRGPNRLRALCPDRGTRTLVAHMRGCCSRCACLRNPDVLSAELAALARVNSEVILGRANFPAALLVGRPRGV